MLKIDQLLIIIGFQIQEIISLLIGIKPYSDIIVCLQTGEK